MGQCYTSDTSNQGDNNTKKSIVRKSKWNNSKQPEQITGSQDEDLQYFLEEGDFFTDDDESDMTSSTNFDKHAPNPNYAQQLKLEQQHTFLFSLSEDIIKKEKLLGHLELKTNLKAKFIQLPSSMEPYQIQSLNAIYIGQWKKGKPYGVGKFYYSDHSVYEGLSINGQPHGHGRKIQTEGSYYEGQFHNGYMQGIGSLVQANGLRYRGDFQANVQHGYGTETWPNGTTYNGHYSQGRKCGYGRFQWPSGENYEGQFIDDEFNGKGKYEWENHHRTYVGMWKDGKMHGLGLFQWQDGRVYEGEYLADLKHGYGVFTWPDGKYWSGTWVLGQMHGLGELTVNGKSYQGEWKNGKRIQWISTVGQTLVSLNTSFEQQSASHSVLK